MKVKDEKRDEVDEQAVAALQQSQHLCLRVCSDGARRGGGGGQSAAGFALLSYSCEGQRTVLRRSGRLLGNLDSSFVAEAVALEWSLELFLDSYAWMYVEI